MSKRFVEDLREKLNKTRAPVTSGAYLRRLITLNDGNSFQSMKHLMDTTAIIQKIETKEHSLNTQISYLTAIVSVLSLFPKYSKIYKTYRAKMIEGANKIKEGYATNEKTDKQKESIIELSEVIKIRESLDKASIEYLLVSLYTMTAPRRNKDYSEMVVVFDEPVLDVTKNYYIASEQQFVFNIFKTAKQYGSQRIDVPAELVKVLDNWILNHPLNDQDEFPLLVTSKGKRINAGNGITRILNNIFDKKIGSSALRHIFLNDKFGASLDERKKIADAMGHSISTQNSYIVK